MNKKITEVSYIGEPKSNTAMFLSTKAGHLLDNLETVENCLIFAEEGLNVPSNLLEKHSFKFSSKPQLAYYYFAKETSDQLTQNNQLKEYKVLDNGARIGENVSLGDDVKIGADVIIEHDSWIGDHVVLGSGAIIQRAIIKNHVRIGENTVIGADGYNLVRDENGNFLSMPTLGTVEISQGVTINSNCTISAGLAGITRIGSFSHIDSLSHIHHDCQIGEEVEIASSVSMGGFTTIKSGSFIGIGTNIKNRIVIGKNVLIGMGSVVIKDIPDNSKAYGVPAQVIE